MSESVAPTMRVDKRAEGAFKIVLPTQIVTIDSESTMDIDDGMFVESRDDVHRVVVCIADPTSLVSVGSTEDENAKLLGATVYVREKAVRKMLPAHISEAKGSLLAGKPRKCFVFEALLDGEELTLKGFNIERRLVTISHRLAYEDVPVILQDEQHDLYKLVADAASLAHKLLAKRRKRGALALYDLTRLLYLDEEGKLVQLARMDQVVGNIIVQEMMVLTNTLAAGFMVENGIPGIFRNHEAKPAAPESCQLAQTIETWLASGAIDADEVQRTFSTLMGKAKYGASVTGHFALAQPFYGHFTSPLRRYADLVNLRQLRSFLKGVDYTLDKGALEQLSVMLNEKADQRKDERSEGFKDVVVRSASRAIERGDLSRLADHEMVQAIKLGVADGVLPRVLVDELTRRFGQSVVTDKITDCLLVSVGVALWPDQLREAFKAWLLLIPTRSVHLLMHAEQTGFVRKVAIDASGDGTSFEGVARVVTSAGDEQLFNGAGARKKDAEQAACVRAVLWLVGCELPVDRESHGTKGIAPRPKGNPKGALLELCQKNGWPMPTFESSGQGPSHTMVFSATVTLNAGGKVVRTDSAGASSKKDAESMASAAMLERVGSLAHGERKAEVQFEHVLPPGATVDGGGNPVGVLQEMAQKNRWKMPDYGFETLREVPPLFRATVTVHGKAVGKFTGEASTKQEAKKRAAAKAVAAVR